MKMFTKNRLVFISIVISLVITCTSCKTESIQVHIFENLAECEAITLDAFTSVQITRADVPDGDQYLKGLTYTDFFACSYSSNELSFDLFAYAFPSQDVAKEYYQNVTGKENGGTATFSDVSGMTYYRRIAIMDNMAYSVYTTPADAETVIALLNEAFSVRIV